MTQKNTNQKNNFSCRKQLANFPEKMFKKSKVANLMIP